MSQEEQHLIKVTQPIRLDRKAFVEEIRSLLGRPFSAGGYTKGVDCFSLVWLGLKKVIPSLPRPKNHLFSDSTLIFEFLDEHLQKKSSCNTPEKGDILVLKFPLSYHCCVVTNLNPFKIIHATANYERVLETRVPSNWLNLIEAIY